MPDVKPPILLAWSSHDGWIRFQIMSAIYEYALPGNLVVKAITQYYAGGKWQAFNFCKKKGKLL